MPYSRRGLGAIPCSMVNAPAGFVGPIDCDATTGPVSYTPTSSDVASLGLSLQAQIDALAASIQAGGSTVGGASSGLLPWLNAHAVTIAVVVAALVGVKVFLGGSR